MCASLESEDCGLLGRASCRPCYAVVSEQTLAVASDNRITRRLLASVFVLFFATHAHADTSQSRVRAAVTAGGDTIRLTAINGGKKPNVKLHAGKKSFEIYDGEAAATLATGHGTTLIAVSIDSAKAPFQILTFSGGKLSTPLGLARPNKRNDYPFAIAATPTPDGFTVFFQEVEFDNANEAHTYMVELDKTGAVSEELKEVQVPWSLAAAAWNGKGYHLALFYTGGGGITLSMVSLSKAGAPEQHPDWASQPGGISDVHLVASSGRIRAFYRNSDRLHETDVTKIGQWGQVAVKAKDLGALAKSQAIAISAKGSATKISAK